MTLPPAPPRSHPLATAELARDVIGGGSSRLVLPMVPAGGLLAVTGGLFRRTGAAVPLCAACLLACSPGSESHTSSGGPDRRWSTGPAPRAG